MISALFYDMVVQIAEGFSNVHILTHYLLLEMVSLDGVAEISQIIVLDGAEVECEGVRALDLWVLLATQSELHFEPLNVELLIDEED